ncbi:MAG: hypothetical protein NWE76_01380 [Candidatus Bathyarchaeota archaeon]|nr:hypothetical protein [Candidatus Bathyarchaeota archaeon]
MSEKIDKIYVEISEGFKVLTESGEHPDLLKVWGYLSRWEALRSDVFRSKVLALRKLRKAEQEYDDGIRKALTGPSSPLSRSAHFEERKAEAETKNFDAFMEVRNYKRLVEELDMLLSHIREKMRWIETLRFQVMEEEKREHYASSKEFSSRG